MEFNIQEMKEITALRGGRKKPTFSLNKGGYFSMNNKFKEMNELQNKKSVNVKAMKKQDKLIVAFLFLDKEDEGTFKLGFGTQSKRSWFSGRSLFSEFGIEYEKLVDKRKSIGFKPNIQNSDGNKYFIIEIPLPKK